MTALSYLFAFVVLLGVLIFVHELGHFLVAKACGVRVLKFSLGFGPPIGIGRFRCAWTRGHTEYVIAWFPLGGFVKMLGENPEEPDDETVLAHPDETLGAKPTWQKLAIVFAGPAMNLALPVAVFSVTLAIGLPRPEAVIGMVETGSPAAVAQLVPGDRILRVDGDPVEWWGSVDDAVRSHPRGVLRMVVERAGEERAVDVPIDVRPGLDEFGGVHDIGWVGLGHSRLRAVLGIPDASAPAQLAGLRSGDLVTAVGDTPVEDWSEMAAAYRAAPGDPVAIHVERGSAESPESATVDVPALGKVAALGIVPANVLVSGVSPDSPAARAGLAPGDLILAVDGEPIGSFASFAELVRSSGGRELDLTIAHAGERRELSVAPELTEVDVGLGIEEPRYLVGITAEAATMLGAVGVDRERNPFVSVPRAAGMTLDITRLFLRGLGKLATGEVSRKQIAGPIGIAQIAGKSLERGWETYLSTLVLISINLGILNLLPIPILDGGQALIFAVEGIKRAPLSLRTREIFQQIGLTFLVLLMGLAFWNDISRHWSDVVDWLRGGAGL